MLLLQTETLKDARVKVVVRIWSALKWPLPRLWLVILLMLERLIKGQNMKALLILLALSFSLSACNTIQGMGKDIEKGGEAIQKSTK